MNTRMKELHHFIPTPPRMIGTIDAGIRVQAIKKEDGDAGIVHFKPRSFQTKTKPSPPCSALTRYVRLDQHHFGDCAGLLR